MERRHIEGDYASLTERGKLRRIGRLAAAALSRYDLRVRSMRIHCFATNLLYRVQSDMGARFILRMAYPGWRTLQDLLAEAAWLDALHADTDIGAPVVIRSMDGDAVLPMSGFGVPDTWYASLLTWVDGKLLAHYLSPDNLERMGMLFAQMHIHGKSWKPPAGFSTRRFEAFLSRGEPDVVFGDGVIQTFREDDRQAFLLARRLVEREYAGINRNDLRVIHCDLWHENIKVDHGRLRPFDFEDTIWGYRLHDIAMSMLDLLETVGASEYEALFASFRSGYERLLDWPEGDLGVLQLGRLLWKANYVARFDLGAVASLSKQYGHIFRNFERTGKVCLSDTSSI